MNQKKTGRFLKELRREKGLTQEQLAEQFQVSNRTISRWETGNNMPDISLLSELAEFYEVSIPEIINGERKSEKMNEEIKEVAEKLYQYCESLVFVTVILVPIYATGVLNEIQRKNTTLLGEVLGRLPRGIQIVVTAIIAFVGAAIIKLFLVDFFVG